MSNAMEMETKCKGEEFCRYRAESVVDAETQVADEEEGRRNLGVLDGEGGEVDLGPLLTQSGHSVDPLVVVDQFGTWASAQ